MPLQRLVRKRDAPAYCGMDKSLFDKHIRPLIETEICAGPKFVAFDIYDLNAAIDTFKETHSKEWKITTEEKQCQRDPKGYSTTKKTKNIVSIQKSMVSDSDNIYEHALSKKRK